MHCRKNTLKKKKAMPGESAEELATTDALVDYRIKVHNIILDTATTCMHRRFLQHGELYADLACLDPLNFPLIKANELPPNALRNISECLLKFSEDASEKVSSKRVHSQSIGL